MQRLLCYPDLYRIDLHVKLGNIIFKLTLLHRKINTLGKERGKKIEKESKICKMLSFLLQDSFFLTNSSFSSSCFLNMFLHQQC